VKVIKPGREQRGWAKEVSCTGEGNSFGGCGALLLVEEGDLFQTSRHSYGDSSPEYFATFVCGACGVLTDLGSGEYPGAPQTLPKRPPKETLL
jgi:hypothetical protein